MSIDKDVDLMSCSRDVSIFVARVARSRKLSVLFACMLSFHLRNMVISLIFNIAQSSHPIILTRGKSPGPLLSHQDGMDVEKFTEMQDKVSYQIRVPAMNRNVFSCAIESG